MYCFFEWDEAKNKSNLSKHGIGFETAGKIINDPNTVRWHCPPDKWDNKIDNYQHNFSVSDDRMLELIGREIKKQFPKHQHEEMIDVIFKLTTRLDPVRDRWIGEWNGKLWSIFTVFRLPKIRIISARRARDEEITAYRSRKL